jgi:hypothetical protein
MVFFSYLSYIYIAHGTKARVGTVGTLRLCLVREITPS